MTVGNNCNSRVTSPDGEANAFFNVGTSCQVTAVVNFPGNKSNEPVFIGQIQLNLGITKTMHGDSRTTFTVVEGSDLISVDANGIVTVKSVGSGQARVAVSFPNYDFASHLDAEKVTIQVVALEALSISVKPYPSYASTFIILQSQFS